ncbi:aminotransferase class V-fold PLP-dependent enzyme [Paractinoplanes durhamensis]|uniref:aminotransferase class V-fold PLP-dependent enzyme n=1 Tax=Paractinoplanes durhamensis TaxID=113563 RepID=UPI003628E65F
MQHPLEWVEKAHDAGYDVLLDVAAYLPANPLDLSRVKPDFVPISWYKVLGYPTGVGCLVARRDTLARLRRPWFAGGTIAAVSVGTEWHQLAPDETAFEDGTLNFLHIPDVEFGLSWLTGIGPELIRDRVRALTGRLLERLAGLRHANGAPLAGSTARPVWTVAAARSPSTCSTRTAGSSTNAWSRPRPRPRGCRCAPAASAIRAPARARSRSAVVSYAARPAGESARSTNT